MSSSKNTRFVGYAVLPVLAIGALSLLGRDIPYAEEAGGAERETRTEDPYKWDLKNLELHLLDTGHCALEEDGDTIAKLIRCLLA